VRVVQNVREEGAKRGEAVCPPRSVGGGVRCCQALAVWTLTYVNAQFSTGPPGERQQTRVWWGGVGGGGGGEVGGGSGRQKVRGRARAARAQKVRVYQVLVGWGGGGVGWGGPAAVRTHRGRQQGAL